MKSKAYKLHRPVIRAYQNLTLEELVRLYNRNEIYRWADKCNIAFHTDITLSQRDFQGFEDDAGIGSATQIANNNTDFEWDVDTNFRILFSIEPAAGDTNIDTTVQVVANNITQGTGEFDVTSTSTHVRIADGIPTHGDLIGADTSPPAHDNYTGAIANYAESDAAPNGGYIEDNGESGTSGGGICNSDIDDDEYALVEVCVVIRSADVDDGDQIDIYLRHGDNATDRAGESFASTNPLTVTANEGVQAQNIEGPEFTNVHEFFDGELIQEQFIEGPEFVDGDTFFNGLVSPQNMFGNTFEDDDFLFDGDLDLTLHGSLFTDADTFFDGQLDLFLEGSLFTDDDTFFTALLEPIAIQGTAFLDGDDLYHGLITHLIEGPEFIDADVLNEGFITYNINGSLFEDSDTLFHGLITHLIEGPQFSDADTFFDGLVSPQNLFGSLLTDADEVFDGDIDLILHGSLFEDADILYHGSLTHLLFGSLLEDADVLNEGLITHLIEGPAFTDEDILYHGAVAEAAGGAQDIEGELFEDADELFHGSITHFIFGQFLDDDDILYHGDIAPQQIFGQFLEDADIFNNGEVLGGAAIIEGQFLDDADLFFQGDIAANFIDGSLLEDADILNDGEVNRGAINVEGQFLTDADTLNDGQLDLHLYGGFLDDTNDVVDGSISPRTMAGGTFGDGDIFYGGAISFPGAVTVTYRYIPVFVVTEDGEVIILYDERFEVSAVSPPILDHFTVPFDTDTV